MYNQTIMTDPFSDKSNGDDSAFNLSALTGLPLVGPLAPDNLDDPVRLRDAVQTTTLLALRAVGVMDARARGLVVQAVLPATITARA